MKRLVLGMAACALSLSALSQSPAPSTAKTYKIGALLAMSGAANWYGTVMGQGIRLAVDEVNAKGGVNGVPLEVVIEDHKSGNAQEAVSAMNRLITLHGVKMVMTSFSVPTQAIAPIADQNKILLLNGGGVSTSLVGVSRYIYHTRSLASDLGIAALQYAGSTGANKLAVLQWKNDTGDSIAKGANPMWKKEGHEIATVEAVPVGGANMDTQVAKVKAANPDVVGLWLYSPEVGMALKRLREFGVKAPIVGVEFTENDAKVAGANSEGFIYATDYFHPSPENPWSQRFAAAYEKRYAAPPEFYAANYYEGVYMLAEVLKRAQAKQPGANLDATAFQGVIADNPKFDSVYGGQMTFQPNGVVVKPIGLFRVEGGQGKFVKYVQVKP